MTVLTSGWEGVKRVWPPSLLPSLPPLHEPVGGCLAQPEPMSPRRGILHSRILWRPGWLTDRPMSVFPLHTYVFILPSIRKMLFCMFILTSIRKIVTSTQNVPFHESHGLGEGRKKRRLCELEGGRCRESHPAGGVRRAELLRRAGVVSAGPGDLATAVGDSCHTTRMVIVLGTSGRPG